MGAELSRILDQFLRIAARQTGVPLPVARHWLQPGNNLRFPVLQRSRCLPMAMA